MHDTIQIHAYGCLDGDNLLLGTDPTQKQTTPAYQESRPARLVLRPNFYFRVYNI